MPDHLHLLLTGTRDNADLARFVRMWKQTSAFVFKHELFARAQADLKVGPYAHRSGVGPHAHQSGVGPYAHQSGVGPYAHRSAVGHDTSPQLWQRGYYDHVLRSDEETERVARYILNNPVRAGLVASPADYPFLGSFATSIDDLLDRAMFDGPA